MKPQILIDSIKCIVTLSVIYWGRSLNLADVFFTVHLKCFQHVLVIAVAPSMTKGVFPAQVPFQYKERLPMYRGYKIIWDHHDGISVLVRQYLYIETVPCCRACGSHTKGRHGWFHSSQLGKSTKSRMSVWTLPRHSIYMEKFNIKAPFARFILMVFSLYFVLPGQLGDITWCTISMST